MQPLSVSRFCCHAFTREARLSSPRPSVTGCYLSALANLDELSPSAEEAAERPPGQCRQCRRAPRTSSSSPYSLRALGERLHAEGYTVVWLRLPGHGTSPSALAHVSWRDWTAAVNVAVCGLRDLLPKGTPLVLGGYSNGGALSVFYALSSIDNTALPNANAIVLFSPMLGINPMARITRLYHMVAMVSGNEKAQWSSVNAEINAQSLNDSMARTNECHEMIPFNTVCHPCLCRWSVVSHVTESIDSCFAYTCTLHLNRHDVESR